MTATSMSFEEWCRALDEIARTKYDFKCDSITGQTGVDCWRMAFDDGVDPETALLEDMSYGT